MFSASWRLRFRDLKVQNKTSRSTVAQEVGFKENISHFLWVDSRNFLTALVLQKGGPILFGECMGHLSDLQ